ncbi:hypothetical protein GCM10018987_52270 [Streptomyces cremeus]
MRGRSRPTVGQRVPATRRRSPWVSVCKALETVEQARRHLYAFHPLTGTADLELGRAADLLRAAGHEDWTDHGKGNRQAVTGEANFRALRFAIPPPRLTALRPPSSPTANTPGRADRR